MRAFILCFVREQTKYPTDGELEERATCPPLQFLEEQEGCMLVKMINEEGCEQLMNMCPDPTTVAPEVIFALEIVLQGIFQEAPAQPPPPPQAPRVGAGNVGGQPAHRVGQPAPQPYQQRPISFAYNIYTSFLQARTVVSSKKQRLRRRVVNSRSQ